MIAFASKYRHETTLTRLKSWGVDYKPGIAPVMAKAQPARMATKVAKRKPQPAPVATAIAPKPKPAKPAPLTARQKLQQVQAEIEDMKAEWVLEDLVEEKARMKKERFDKKIQQKVYEMQLNEL